MKKLLTLATLAASCMAVATPAMAQRSAPYRAPVMSPEDAQFQQAQDRFQRELDLFQQAFQRYQQYRSSNRDYPPPPPPRGGPGYSNGGYDYSYDDRDEGDYDASRYYRSGPNYQERVMRSDERVYRGDDGKYYCKRSDGTTGLIIGGIAGAGLGNVIDGGHSRTAGTVIGALIGAVAGKAIQQNSEQNQLRCR